MDGTDNSNGLCDQMSDLLSSPKKKSAISQFADQVQQLQQLPVTMSHNELDNQQNYTNFQPNGSTDTIVRLSSCTEMSGSFTIDNDPNDESKGRFELFAKKVQNYSKVSRFVRSSSVLVKTDVDGERLQVPPVTAAWFLGPKAENEKVLKELIGIAIDQHVDFRKFKYFPLDPNYVTESLQEEESYRKSISNMRRKLKFLSKRLNNSVPFFNFRSQGHMLWDTTLPSNVGYIAALLYNQNNVASMASGVTLQLEREVAKDLCRMVGYKVYSEYSEDDTDTYDANKPGSWGHLPNGGTVANLEAMWAARCLKFNGLALQKLIKKRFGQLGLQVTRDTFKFKNLAGEEVLLRDADAWELLNIPIDEAIDLFDKICDSIRDNDSVEGIGFDELFGHVKEFTMEELGAWEFFQTFQAEYEKAGVTQGGRWLTPGSRHYSWDKGANILGLGRRNLIKIPVNEVCRVDIPALSAHLEDCLHHRIPVLGVVAVFGTTQEGAVDELDKILDLRKSFEARGMTFYIHIDGAWGGYFASALHPGPIAAANDQFVFETMRNDSIDRTDSNIFNQAKLSNHFELQLRNIQYANSITLDPHKSGFCPYPAGGLLYRNGNIRKFLAQKAAYVSHGTGRNEEINLFGIDGSKPGAASAGVWLSHKVIGLHDEGYGLLLQQCTFSAGIMYAMWVSMEHPQDPFTIQHAVPIRQEERWAKWTKAKIRREILDADNSSFEDNFDAMDFLTENGPDSLINCISMNIRSWNKETAQWELNSSMEIQRLFHEKFYKRCCHSFEKPSMVDRGIQIILNSTIWEKDTHSGAYNYMKDRLGLDMEDESRMSVIINTCMTPWLRTQKTFKRIGTIIRNEMYNAYGAIYDEPQHLKFVSPCIINSYDWTGEVFAELEASFSNASLSYHCVGSFFFDDKDLNEIIHMASQASDYETEYKTLLPLRIITREKMRVYDLMTNSNESINKLIDHNPDDDRSIIDDDEDTESIINDEVNPPSDSQRLKDKLLQYSECNMDYDDIAMPAVPVIVYFGNNLFDTKLKVETRMKLKRVIRYHHLGRDFVDEADFPPTQEYMLYACLRTNRAYLSHCPNRWPDFQQLIVLDEIPQLTGDEEKNLLYQEALQRGVVVHLPQVLSGGRPVMSKKKPNVCRDPLKDHAYDAVSWSDQGAFTGDMTTIKIKFYGEGKRWFEGDRINRDYDKQNFPHLYDERGERRESEWDAEDDED